jgi:phage tail sheath protein FI
MPEYLAPGVYVEEVSFRPKSIEGVSTSTTAFVGPMRRGPVGGTPEVITSLGEFTRVYGGAGNLSFSAATDAAPETLNYLWHAVRQFFDNGGARLYIGRTFLARNNDDGVAESAPIAGEGDTATRFRARFPGSGLNGEVRISEKLTPIAGDAALNAAPAGSMLRNRTSENDNTPGFFVKGADWRDSADAALPAATETTRRELLTLNVEVVDADGNSLLYEDVGYAPTHRRFIGALLPQVPSRRADDLQNPYYLDIQGNVSPFDLRTGLLAQAVWRLEGGNDGGEPNDAAYDAALEAVELVEDISIVAAPGHSSFGDYRAIQGSLISHAERLKYRIAVLDTPPDATPGQARDERGRVDTKYGAMYYPWVVVSNPLARPGDESIPREIALPPSGFLAGVYARTDILRGVWKAPANEVVRGAIRFEREITRGQQEVLNPEGINCLRYFPGRGFLVWGARTASSDPEWKYVNVRRYFIYLEHSIDRSTQWAVFEPNGPRLWANVVDTVSAFLYSEWRNGALLGATPEEAFFVRCDRSTMTQNDLDNGRLVCEIGVAVLYPAEFVIFRIGQKTADTRA